MFGNQLGENQDSASFPVLYDSELFMSKCNREYSYATKKQYCEKNADTSDVRNALYVTLRKGLG
jgi:hypothetical protein